MCFNEGHGEAYKRGCVAGHTNQVKLKKLLRGRGNYSMHKGYSYLIFCYSINQPVPLTSAITEPKQVDLSIRFQWLYDFKSSIQTKCIVNVCNINPNRNGFDWEYLVTYYNYNNKNHIYIQRFGKVKVSFEG